MLLVGHLHFFLRQRKFGLNASEVTNNTPAIYQSITIISQATHVANAARVVWDEALEVSNRVDQLAHRPAELSSLIGNAENLAVALMAQTALANNQVAEIVSQPVSNMGAPMFDVLWYSNYLRPMLYSYAPVAAP